MRSRDAAVLFCILLGCLLILLSACVEGTRRGHVRTRRRSSNTISSNRHNAIKHDDNDDAASPICRYAPNYTTQDLFSSEAAREEFRQLAAYWEGKFHQDGVGISFPAGLTYDGHGIDFETGELHVPPHLFSAPSKESIHVGMLALAIQGNPYARTFVGSTINNKNHDFSKYTNLGVDPVTAAALQVLDNKMSSYERFNAQYPGFGGFFPWYAVNDSGIFLLDSNWIDQVPGLDNGELIWALIACAHTLQEAGFHDLAQRYWNQISLMQRNVLTIFYDGGGRIRAVTQINDTKAQPTPSNYANAGGGILDDPYEGELMAFFMDLYGPWEHDGYSIDEREKIWILKRTQLKSVQLNTPKGPITVEEGYWYSSHEKWKYLMLPYLDVPINARVFRNGERARTWYSAMNNIPGMYASVTDVSTPPQYNPPDYISATGIQPIASQQVLRRDIVTPYASFPVFLAAGDEYALPWYNVMLNGPRMQGPYGSTESCNINGTLISPVMTWDSKITTMLAMSSTYNNSQSSIFGINAKILQANGLYARFYEIVEREWTLVFGSGDLPGEDLPFMLPNAELPIHNSQTDFTTCVRQ